MVPHDVHRAFALAFLITGIQSKDIKPPLSLESRRFYYNYYGYTGETVISCLLNASFFSLTKPVLVIRVDGVCELLFE